MSRLRWDISLVIRISTITEIFGHIRAWFWHVLGIIEAYLMLEYVKRWSRTEGFRRAGTFGPLLAPQEGPVEDGTCRTNHGTHLEGILSPKNWTGLAGGVKNGHFLAKIWLRSPP